MFSISDGLSAAAGAPSVCTVRKPQARVVPSGMKKGALVDVREHVCRSKKQIGAHRTMCARIPPHVRERARCFVYIIEYVGLCINNAHTRRPRSRSHTHTHTHTGKCTRQ